MLRRRLAHHRSAELPSDQGRDLFLIDLAGPQDLPAGLDLPSQHHAALVVWHSDKTPVEVVSQVVTRLLDDGCVVLDFWGAGCERAHDIADEVIVLRDLDEPKGSDPPLIQTCWYADQPLDDALFALLCCSGPDEVFAPATRAAVVILIGADAASRDRARLAMTHPERFLEGLGTEDGEPTGQLSGNSVRLGLVLILGLSTAFSGRLFAIQGVSWSRAFRLVWTAPLELAPGLGIFALGLFAVGLLAPATRWGPVCGCLGAAGWVALGFLAVGMLVT